MPTVAAGGVKATGERDRKCVVAADLLLGRDSCLQRGAVGVAELLPVSFPLSLCLLSAVFSSSMSFPVWSLIDETVGTLEPIVCTGLVMLATEPAAAGATMLATVALSSSLIALMTFAV